MIQMSLFEDTLEEKLVEAITEDLKGGSGFTDGKKRIKAMYEKDITKSERIKLLKDEYGVGGYSNGEISQKHDSKGIEIELYTGGTKHYTWGEIHDLILTLINIGQY